MALLRHSGIYFLARILSGAAGFAIIAAYTRLLDPHAFGELALAMAGVGFFVVLITDSPAPTLLRYLPTHSPGARATMLWGLVIPTVALCILATLAILVAAPERWREILALCTGLLASTALHKFQLTTAQGAMRPGKYAWLGGLESMVDMLLGITLVWLGYGVAGALIGTMLATMTALAVNWRGWWIGWHHFDPQLGSKMLRFGLPLMLGGLFGWLATFADRWLLGIYVSTEQAGLYAAGYDLLMNLLGVPMMVMALAGYPLTISAYSESGVPAAQAQLRQLGTFIILILLPEAVGIVMTGPLLVNIFLGEEFRPLTLSLLPFLIGATFLKALMLYINYGYVLAGRTDITLLSMAGAAVVDIILNLTLIPGYGAWGAAIAALIGFGAGFAIAAIKIGRVFPFPLPDPGILTAGLIGVAVMAAWLWPFHYVTAWSAVLYVIPVAILIYFGSVFFVLQLTGRKPLELMHGLWGGETSTKLSG